MRRLVRYLKPYRGAVVVSLFFLLLQSITQVAGPLLTKLAIDRYLVKPDYPVHSPLDHGLPPTSGPASRKSPPFISPRC